MSELFNGNGNLNQAASTSSNLVVNSKFNFAELADFEYAAPDEQSPLLTAIQQSTYTPDFKSIALRRCFATKTNSFQWNVPGTDFREVQRDIVAVRGVMLEPRFGFFLFNSETRKPHCQTVGAEHNSGLKLDDPMPFPLPIYSPSEYDKEGKNPPTPVKELAVWNPMGSRGKTCSECVLAGEHIRQYVNSKGEPQKDECGLSSQVIFYVTQFGVLKTNPLKRTRELEWINVVDLKEDGQAQFDRPVIINFNISRMPTTRPIGQKLQVKTIANGGFAPVDSETLGKFLRNLNAAGLVRPLRGGKRLAYTAIVELHAAQPTEAFPVSPMTQCIPVFSVCQDPALNAQLESTLRMAFQQYAVELMEAVNRPSIPSSAPQEPEGGMGITVLPPSAPTDPSTPANTEEDDDDSLVSTSAVLSENIFSR